MSMINSMSRMRGQEKGPGYTQTETILGEAMQRFGRELGEDSNFGEFKHKRTTETLTGTSNLLKLYKNKVFSNSVM